MRTDIEDRIRDAKLVPRCATCPPRNAPSTPCGGGQRCWPSTLCAWLQELAGLDGGNGRGRAHLGTLRHRLVNVAARLIRRSGQIILPLPPGQQLLAQVLSRLRKLPAWT